MEFLTDVFSMIKKFIRKKYARIALWSIGIVLAFVFLLLVIADIYIHSRKAEITEKIKTLISESVNGEVIIKNVDVSLFATFPYAGINVYGASILDSQYHRPLLNANYASCRINILQLLSANPTISKLVIRNGGFHFFTDSNGYSNSYLLLKKNPQKKKNSVNVVIRHVELENVSALIEDVPKRKRFDFIFNDLDAHIDKDDSLFTIKMDEQAFIRGLGFNLDRGRFLDSQTVNAKKWVLKFNAITKELFFGKTSINVNGFRYTLNGFFRFKDSGSFQLHASTKATPYKKIVLLLTQNIKDKIGTLGIEGLMDASADLKGNLSYLSQPYITVNFSTRNDEIITPIASFTDCSFTGHFNNQFADSLPISDENSVVLVNNFKGNWGEIQLNADSIQLLNVIRPVIKFVFLSKCNFETLDDQLSLESIDFTGGTAELYLQYNGPLIASPALLSKLTADIRLHDASLVYNPRDITFSNCNGSVSVSENNITVDSLRCDIKGNHFEINAKANNVNGLTNQNMEKASVTCDVFTPSIDLDDFRSVFAKRRHRSSRRSTSKLAATAAKVDDILNSGDLEMNVRANHLNLKNFNADKVTAQIIFHGDDWDIKKANLLHANGSLSVAGGVHTSDGDYHAGTAKLIADNVNISKLFYGFNNFGLNSLGYQNVRGTVTANADLSFTTNSTGHINPGSIQGTVDFDIKNGALVNFIPVEKLQDIAFLNHDLSNIMFAELKNKMTIKGDIVEIPRMEIASSAITMYVEGVYGLKNNTDLTLQIPLTNLKRVDSTYKPTNKGNDAKVGPSVYVRATDDENGKIKFKLQLFRKKKKNLDADNNSNK